jgi:hypothetical protein
MARNSDKNRVKIRNINIHILEIHVGINGEAKHEIKINK